MTDHIQNAIDKLTAYGLVVDQFTADGKLRRVKTNDDKGSKKSGWYVAHEFSLDSGRMVISGRFGNWKMSSEPQAFQFDASFTDEEKAAFKKQQEQQRKAAEKEKRHRQQQAAKRAEQIWPGLPTDGHSDYLARKKIHGFGCRYSKGSIAIPLSNADGDIVGLQWIDGKGGKKFLTGTAKRGASFVIDDGRIWPTILCEGYATGCSIAMARPEATVIVCFDAGNLETIARDRAMRDLDCLIAADNDHGKDKNAGLQVAANVMADYPNVRAVWPEGIEGTDFNDLHVENGLDAVKAAFERSEPQAFPANIAENAHDIDAPPKPPAVDGLPELDDPAWRDRLVRAKGKNGDPGAVLPWASNIALIFENDSTFKKSLSYCEFSYRIIKRRKILPQVAAGEWTDGDTSASLIWMARRYGFEPSDPKMAHALVDVAQLNSFHPVREYLDGLQWDGTERLDAWLQDVYESPASSEYLAAAGRKFLIGAVARIFRPGCKMDNVLILEGPQGLQKSTSVHRLFGDWFSDAPIPLGDKDSYQNIQGVWCHELAELDSFNKVESTTAKNFFTQTRDRYRPSYGHRAQDFPRQTVFVGTTNQDEYLKDYTGNRRYWPVKCSTVRLDTIESNRDQYWAEAVHLFRQNAVWWVESDAERQLFEAEQDSRLQIDPWQYHIEDYLRGLTAHHVTSADILGNAIEKDAGHVTKADQNRISPIMKALGWQHKKKRIMVGSQKVPRWVYVRPGTA